VALESAATQLVRHSDSRQISMWIAGIGKARIQYCECIGNLIAWLMVVGDDQVDTQITRSLSSSVRRDPAINRDQHLGPRRMCAIDAIRVKTVSLDQTVRNAVLDVSANRAQTGNQDDRARDSIDIVVAVHNDAFTARDGPEETLHSRLHLDELER
jgi:hypothetical protein